MAMASKWTNTVPSVPGNYWVALVIKGKLAHPEILNLKQIDLEYAETVKGEIMFGDSKIPEPLWEKI
jgi:hypothetical protein